MKVSKVWRRAVGVTDWLVVVLLGGTALYEIWIHPLIEGIPGSRPVNTVIFLMIGLAFAWRRRAPTIVLFVVVTALLVQMLFVDPSPPPPLQSFLALLLAFYSVAAHAGERRAVLGGALAAASIVAVDIPQLLAGVNPGNVIPTWIFVGAVWAMGWTLHRRRLQAVWLESRAAALEHEREEQARAAVAEERARISRELHDVVAHGVSVTVVQAQAAQRLLEGEQPETRKALGAIETTGRQALVELRRMLGVLRQTDDQLTLAPQPGLGSLEDLAEQFRASGLPVELRVEGEVSPLPPGVDLSAYRIVQEALTNTLKHAGPACAVVTVRYRNDEVELEVADDGPGTGEGEGSGHGIIGMRERATLYGGTFESGEREGGGYLVRARLSLGSPVGDPDAKERA